MRLSTRAETRLVDFWRIDAMKTLAVFRQVPTHIEILIKLGAIITCALGASVLAQQTASKCVTTESELAFVLGSLEEVRTGTPLPSILDTLQCIATHSHDRRAASAAVIAIYELGGGLGSAHERLVSIVLDESVNDDSRTTACSLLALGANEPIRHRLLQYIEAHWTDPKAYCIRRALLDLRDDRYAKLLVGNTSAMPDSSPYKLQDQRELALLRGASAPDGILSLIRCSEEGIDRAWLVYQAGRERVPVEELRAAIRDYLRLPADVTGHHDKSRLVRAGLTLGVFESSDDDEFPVVGLLRRHSQGEELSPLSWADLHRTKWREVHGVEPEGMEQSISQQPDE